MTPSLYGRLDRRPPATTAAIEDLTRFAGRILPADYIQFLRECDGAKGWVREDLYLELWSVEDVIANTRAARGSRSSSQLLFFGGDGSREMLCFDLASDPAEVLLLDITYESPADSPWRIPGFSALLAHLATSSLFEPPT